MAGPSGFVTGKPTAAAGAGIPVKAETAAARNTAIETALRQAKQRGLTFNELSEHMPNEPWLTPDHKRAALSNVLTRLRMRGRAAAGDDQRWRVTA